MLGDGARGYEIEMIKPDPQTDQDQRQGSRAKKYPSFPARHGILLLFDGVGFAGMQAHLSVSDQADRMA